MIVIGILLFICICIITLFNYFTLSNLIFFEKEKYDEEFFRHICSEMKKNIEMKKRIEMNKINGLYKINE